METLLKIFSTRELSLILWIIIALIAMMFGKNIRKALGSVLKAFFEKEVFSIFLLLILYTLSIICLLSSYRIWNISLIKDTAFWFFTVAITLIFTTNKAKDLNHFRDILNESFKWTIFVEFIMNFYTFSFWIEVIVMPFLVLLVLMQTFSENDQKYNKVNSLLKKTLSTIGISFFLLAFYKTLVNYQDLITMQNLYSFLLPPVLTILLLPFLYILALIMNYEVLFIRIDFMTQDAKERATLKRKIAVEANFNLNRLSVISKRSWLEELKKELNIID